MFEVSNFSVFLCYYIRPRSGKTKSVNKLATKKSNNKDVSSVEDLMKPENLLDDRIHLANTISELEETEDGLQFSATKDDILEDNEDLSSGKSHSNKLISFQLLLPHISPFIFLRVLVYPFAHSILVFVASFRMYVYVL